VESECVVGKHVLTNETVANWEGQRNPKMYF